jgi:hypothetical protein
MIRPPLDAGIVRCQTAQVLADAERARSRRMQRRPPAARGARTARARRRAGVALVSLGLHLLAGAG